MGWLRHPKATQELRRVTREERGYIRGARKKLPTSYDDLMQCYARTASWKLSRLKQYRTKDV